MEEDKTITEILLELAEEEVKELKKENARLRMVIKKINIQNDDLKYELGSIYDLANRLS